MLSYKSTQNRLIIRSCFGPLPEAKEQSTNSCTDPLLHSARPSRCIKYPVEADKRPRARRGPGNDTVSQAGMRNPSYQPRKHLGAHTRPQNALTIVYRRYKPVRSDAAMSQPRTCSMPESPSFTHMDSMRLFAEEHMYNNCRRSICRISCTTVSCTACTVNFSGTEQRFSYIASAEKVEVTCRSLELQFAAGRCRLCFQEAAQAPR